jgi:hypothetical protein
LSHVGHQKTPKLLSAAVKDSNGTQRPAALGKGGFRSSTEGPAVAAAVSTLSAARAAAMDILAMVSKSAAAAAESAPEEREREAVRMSCFANSTAWRSYPYNSFHSVFFRVKKNQKKTPNGMEM